MYDEEASIQARFWVNVKKQLREIRFVCTVLWDSFCPLVLKFKVIYIPTCHQRNPKVELKFTVNTSRSMFTLKQICTGFIC